MSSAESVPRASGPDEPDRPEQDQPEQVAGNEEEQAEKPAGAPGGPFVLILFVIALIPGILLGNLAGAGAASIVGAFGALFTLIAILGGPLRAGLRLAAILAPAMVFASVVPRLVAEVSRPGAIALVVVIVFLASLVPLFGPRFVTAGMALAMVTLFSYGIALAGPTGPLQLVLSSLIGLAVAVLIRVLFGISDPGKPTRAKIADTLDADEAGLGDAFDLWIVDGRKRWLGAILGGASRYRVALHAAEALDRPEDDDDPDATEAALAAEAAALKARAHAIADRIRAKRKPGEEPAEEPETPAPAPPAAPLPDAIRVFLDRAAAALDDVEAAEAGRDTAPIEIDDEHEGELRRTSLRPAVRLRSIQVRHAVRAAIGSLLLLLLVLPVEPGSPLVATTLLTGFSVMAASWRESFEKARPRIIGVLCGGLAAAVIVIFVPDNILVVVAALSLVVGLWNIISRPALGYGLMVLVSVGFASGLRHLDPFRTLAQYVFLILVAVAIGAVVGFAVIPGLRPEPLRTRIHAARAATVRALRATLGASTSGDSVSDVAGLQRTAREARQELVPDHDKLDDDQLAQLGRLQIALDDLAVLGSSDARVGDAGLAAVLDALGEDEAVGEGAIEPRAVAPGEPSAVVMLSSAVVGLARQVRDTERDLLASLPGKS